MNNQVVCATLAILTFLSATWAETQPTPPPTRWIHPSCRPLECTRNGPFLQSDDGSLLAIDGNVLRTSTDGGKTWSEPGAPITPGMDFNYVGHTAQPLRTRDGALVFLFLDFTGYKFSWNDQLGVPNPECLLELWAIRSLDNGQTWTDKQRLLGGYNADFMGFIQTSAGRLVATVEHLDPVFGRWMVCSFVSDDEGQTWKQGNWIDLGGHGHHDGAVEPTVVELKDGRLMMLIRTSLDRFWRAYSDDGGRYWRTIEPTNIDASSAPSWLLHLKSGRLALVWNRVKAEGATTAPKHAAGQASESLVSWFREELSIAFSEDDGTTWTQPVVIAREPKGQLAYPYILERTPGELWVFTRYTFHEGGVTAPPVAVALNEQDFLQPSGAAPQKSE